MSASFRRPEVTLDGAALRVRCEIVNRTPEAWLPEEGWAAGYQLFDEPTGTLVVDGEHTALDVAPAKSRTMAIAVPLPPEPGEYNIFVSVLREHVAWFYQKGWPFLLIHVRVGEDGVTRLGGWRIANRRSLALRHIARSFRRALTLPLHSVWTHRNLIRTLVRRDILSRYSGSFGGAFWAVLNPLLLMLTYFFVFGVVLKQRFGNDPSQAGFAIYFLAGMLPWLAFSEAAGRAPFVLVEHRNFIRKLVFPVETLPVNLVVSGLVTEFFGVILFALALVIVRGRVPWSVVWLPALIVPQVLFTAGICWFLAALGVFVRDLSQVIGFLLTIWFFVTPICYPEASLPPEALRFARWNPIFVLVRGYRAILLESRPPDWRPLLALAVLSVFVFIAGYAWFYKLRRSFADLI